MFLLQFIKIKIHLFSTFEHAVSVVLVVLFLNHYHKVVRLYGNIKTLIIKRCHTFYMIL